jgi:hypothetical protein
MGGGGGMRKDVMRNKSGKENKYKKSIEKIR